MVEEGHKEWVKDGGADRAPKKKKDADKLAAPAPQEEGNDKKKKHDELKPLAGYNYLDIPDIP